MYALCGDGCMMEGISAEAASLAGHWKLSNLCWVYDRNKITIEGNTDLAFTEDVAARFLAHGWNVTRVGDANDLEVLDRAFRHVQGHHRPADADRRREPHRLGAPHKQDTSAAHGEPLGEEEVRLTKRAYGWPEDAKFLVPDGRLRTLPRGHRRARRATAGRRGPSGSSSYRTEYPELADQLARMLQRRAARTDGTGTCRRSPRTPRAMATRDASGQVLNAIGEERPVAGRRVGRPGPVDARRG